MMVMETRQQIEEAESQEDLMALQQTNEAKRRDCIQVRGPESGPGASKGSPVCPPLLALIANLCFGLGHCCSHR